MSQLTTRAIVLADDDIDTDQIIPARYLVTTDREGLGEACLIDRRVGPDGVPDPRSPFSDPRASGAAVLVAGANFGCGSSREHAAWALGAFGFRAIIAPSFADIFASNASKNGILTATVSPEDWRHIAGESFPKVRVDVEACAIECGGRRIAFTIDAFARRCLLDGVDPLGYLLDNVDAIERHERATQEAQGTKGAPTCA